MNGFWEEIAGSIKLNLRRGEPWVIQTSQEYLLDYIVKILSFKLEGRVEILVFDEHFGEVFESRKSFGVEVGSTFEHKDLEELGFDRVSRVWNPGEYSVLGDVIVFWPKGEKMVVRVSLDGDKVEQLSYLDPQTRRLEKHIKRYELSGDSNELRSRYIWGEEANATYTFYYFRKVWDGCVPIDLGIRPFPGLNQNHIEKLLSTYSQQGFDLYTTSNLNEFTSLKLKHLDEPLPRGFVMTSSKVALLTDFELLGRLDLNENGKKQSTNQEKIFKEIVRGDFVVHQDHGIGVYEDLVSQDGSLYLDIHYSGDDRLLVPLSAADKLTKYVGAGRGTPILTGLNSGVWGRVKRKAAEDIMAMASELVQLYAMRSMVKVKQIIRGDYQVDALQEFISKFQYEDTEDQAVITQQIVEDFSKEKPMDRLIVGDVGFGKTELAARAMFMTVNSGYQVAFLVPTTVLSLQHFKVLQERFNDYPFKVSLLNRFITGKEREEIIEDTLSGKVDILIGTHSLLSEEVGFKNLGLMVVDEEQKFGVVQKEAMKKKRLNVSVLSMTATPIPRTLNMSLAGIRDLSILASVPLGRKSIKNNIGTFDWNIVESAINKEVSRGGQVYYLHNRINDLEPLKYEIEKRMGDVKIGIAHGRMGELKINKVMKDFIDRKIDVLVCSTIIENGLDIPNVNTIIVDDAQRYGLASLYQIRGRVGRSERQAYAYIMYSNLRGNALLRIDALSEANNIGSGFVLSSRDLEIRGAGNILGKSQSGAINSVGYGLYTQMLNDAVKELQDVSY
ncbi:DEAD/DEAH box helicase [bacterium]|nr:DEAD/DEAH box helicase [bacterium]